MRVSAIRYERGFYIPLNSAWNMIEVDRKCILNIHIFGNTHHPPYTNVMMTADYLFNSVIASHAHNPRIWISHINIHMCVDNKYTYDEGSSGCNIPYVWSSCCAHISLEAMHIWWPPIIDRTDDLIICLSMRTARCVVYVARSSDSEFV